MRLRLHPCRTLACHERRGCLRTRPPEEVVAHEGRGLEEQRLDERQGSLERSPTQELLARAWCHWTPSMLNVGWV